MKVRLHKLSLGLAASVVLFAALPAHAANKYGCIYAVDPWDKIVKDPYGHCIRTPYWTAEKDVAECGGGARPEPPPPTCEKVTLGTDALFDFDKATLRPKAKAKLAALVAKSKAIKLEVIIAVGHTDRFGSDAYNQKLSEKRAAAVKAYLVSKGIEANRVYTEGKGKKNPVTKPDQCPGPKSKKTIACLQPDRRVDIELIGTK